MSIRDALTAPTGVQNQMVGQPSRVPGYSQGLGQAPGQMALPPEPMPIGRPTAVVGGPAYFTPQGYNAPPQPTEAFMPTDRAPDPIGQQFMRQMQSPMGQQFQQQYEATQAPIREAEMAKRAEEQAAQDARFQEMMDRIAELEGQLATPEPAPMPGPDPYVPGGPFPGIPDFIRDLDFSNIPGLSNFDYDDIMRQYNDRIEMGEPEPIESFLPDLRDLPPIGLNPPPGGFGGRDFDNPSFRSAGAMPPENNFFVDGDGNLNVGDGIIRPMGMPAGPAPGPIFQQSAGNNPFKINELGLEKAIADMGAVRKKMPELPDFSNIPAPTPASSFMPEGMTEDFAKRVTDAGIDLSDTASYLYSPAAGRSGQSLIPMPKISGPNPDYIPPAVPPANIPNIGAIKPVSMENIDNNRPMIPDFGRMNLR